MHFFGTERPWDWAGLKLLATTNLGYRFYLKHHQNWYPHQWVINVLISTIFVQCKRWVDIVIKSPLSKYFLWPFPLQSFLCTFLHANFILITADGRYQLKHRLSHCHCMLCGVSSGRSPSSNPKAYQRPSWNEGLFSRSQQCQPAESNLRFHSLALVLLCGVRKLASKSWPLQIACAMASKTIFRGEYISPHLQSLRLVHFLIIFYNYCWCQLYN